MEIINDVQRRHDFVFLFDVQDGNPNGDPDAGNLPQWIRKPCPGHAISIFFSDGQGGVFYKSIPLRGAPTDITVSRDGKWLAVIYTAGGEGYVSVFAIDSYGDLTPVATSNSIGVAGFNGVAFSQ